LAQYPVEFIADEGARSNTVRILLLIAFIMFKKKGTVKR